MSIFKKLSNLFSSPSRIDDASYWFYVQCARCGEKIRGRVDMRNDISINYGENSGQTTYFTRKTVIGEQRCYQPIEVELTFNSRYQLIDQKVTGGKRITQEEFEAEAQP